MDKGGLRTVRVLESPVLRLRGLPSESVSAPSKPAEGSPGPAFALKAPTARRPAWLREARIADENKAKQIRGV